MFLETLNSLMESNGLNKNTLSKYSGIPYTTIVGFYTKGTDNVKLSTLRKLADYFNVSLDFLINGQDATENTDSIENELMTSFNKLNKKGKTEAVKRVTELTQITEYTFSNLSDTGTAI